MQEQTQFKRITKEDFKKRKKAFLTEGSSEGYPPCILLDLETSELRKKVLDFVKKGYIKLEEPGILDKPLDSFFLYVKPDGKWYLDTIADSEVVGLEKCLKCGKLFQIPRKDQKICNRCKREEKYRSTCLKCGKTFLAFGRNRRSPFCPDCEVEIEEKKKAARFKKCSCGKEFLPKHRFHKYCSECREKFIQQNKKVIQKKKMPILQ